MPQTLKISILGDSISTYEGFAPYGYHVYYREGRIFENGLTGVEDTWWMQTIHALGGTLCENASFSGSTVAGAYFPAACSDERCRAVGAGDAPDLILIYMGTNDRGFEISLGLEYPEDPFGFYGAYRSMLQKLKRLYPQAKIACATLPMGRLEEEDPAAYDRFMREDARYDEVIARAVREEGCILAGLVAFGERYETLDFCHPTRAGHRTLAELWLRALEKEGFQRTEKG